MNPAFYISPQAQKKLTEIFEKKNKHLRISVTSGGCSGFQYKLDLEDVVTKDDHVIEAGLIKVIIDDTSFPLLQGSTLDYTTELMGSHFKIVNPNASESCGCGGSFGL